MPINDPTVDDQAHADAAELLAYMKERDEQRRTTSWSIAFVLAISAVGGYALLLLAN